MAYTVREPLLRGRRQCAADFDDLRAQEWQTSEDDHLGNELI